MSERFDVIVVGSGIGGLTAALTCARQKRSVLLLEAGKQFGGYTNPFSRKHFHFDPGIHYIGECGPNGSFRHLLDRLGLQHVGFTELDPDGFDHYVFPDYEVKNCVGLDRFRDRLAADFPRERDGLDRFFKLLHDVDTTLRVAPRMKTANDLFTVLRSAPGLLRWSRATLKELLDHHFDDVRLKAALAGPCGDLGLPPSRLSAFLHMGVLTHYSRGAYFPKGGSAGLRDGFVDALAEEGAVMHRNARVERILQENGRVTGVRLVDGRTFHSDVVISNAQATDTYAMVGLEHLGRRLRTKVETTEHSYGSLVVFLGVDGKLDTSRLGSANVWSYGTTDIDATYADSLDLADGASSFFLTVPTNKDPEGRLAPPGMQTVELVTLCPAKPFEKWFGDKTMKRGDEYESLKKKIADHYLALAEKHLPGLRDHVVLEEIGSPATNVSFTLSPAGNIYGPAHTPAQTPPFRFAAQAPIEGLFLCGASVLGCGIVPCASSGRSAGKLALAHLEQRPSRLAPAMRQLRAVLG